MYSVAKELVHAKTGGVLKGVFDESEEGDEYDSKTKKNQHVADWLFTSARLQESVSVQGVDVESVKMIHEEQEEGLRTFQTLLKIDFQIFFGTKFSSSFGEEDQYFTPQNEMKSGRKL